MLVTIFCFIRLIPIFQRNTKHRIKYSQKTRKKMKLLAFITFASLTLAQTEECITNPTLPACTSFVLTDETALTDLADLCKNMPFMVSCSMQKMCSAEQNINESVQKYCSPFSLLADGCAVDMPRMGGCARYSGMCGISRNVSGIAVPADPSSLFRNTVVSQCTTASPLPLLPSTAQVNTQVKSICAEMDMIGCDKCKITPQGGRTYLDCDILGVYSELCQAMPEMSQCGAWKSMCQQSPNLPLCLTAENGNRNAPPTMKMFFHTGITDYVLFENFVPRTNSEYAWAWVFCFVISVVYEGLVAFASIMEVKWANSDKASACFPARLATATTLDSSNEAVTTVKTNSNSGYIVKGTSIALQRSVMKFINATIGYAVMLVTMTFNVGLYFAVILGLAVGTFFFAGFVRRAAYGSTFPQVKAVGSSCCS